MSAPIEYRHVDVFASAPFTGNGLIVVFASPRSLRAETLILLAAELRQFELIVVDADPRGNRVSARIFTAQEELPFAGHPIIGAAAALHEHHAGDAVRSWVFVIAGRDIEVRSERTGRYYAAEMNQGRPDRQPPLDDTAAAPFARARLGPR